MENVMHIPTHRLCRQVATALLALAMSACSAQNTAASAYGIATETASEASQTEAPQVTTGNGVENHIKTEGIQRTGRDFLVPEVRLANNGWLVLHPFRDGKPVGEIYAGATYLPAGTHQNVTVTAQTVPMPEPGTLFIVMLHQDVNNDQTFDFVFVDERNVADKAVFEGTTMIGHAIAAP